MTGARASNTAAPMLPDGPDAVAAIAPIDDVARERLEAYAALLRRWQPVKNLVAPSTLPDLWRRHFADGAQAFAARPEAMRWLDLGSGAGFPGLVTAILLADRPGGHVTLVESNGRKAAFLLAVARELKLPATILSERIEAVPLRHPALLDAVDAVSARALASFATLLGQAEPWLSRGAAGVFHKGQDFDAERVEASHVFDFDLVEKPSRVDAASRMVIVTGVRRR